MTYHCVYFVQSSFSPRHYCLYLTNILSQRLYNIWYAYLPIIIRNGCHEKYLQPAPAGCIAAQYPPIRACKDSTASRTTYFYVMKIEQMFLVDEFFSECIFNILKDIHKLHTSDYNIT